MYMNSDAATFTGWVYVGRNTAEMVEFLHLSETEEYDGAQCGKASKANGCAAESVAVFAPTGQSYEETAAFTNELSAALG